VTCGLEIRVAISETSSVVRTLDMTLGSLAVVVIRSYQRYLSPLKGYSCAHRVRHGGESCSAYARQVFAAEGMRVGVNKLRRRFRECHLAGQALKSGEASTRPHDEFFDAPPTPEDKSPTKSAPERSFEECLLEGVNQGVSKCCLMICVSALGG
jgi:putative component of membrane protein insertase Oxa1/YidC/SpoIIIJ protein YidD